jgi:hypothetical protein
MSSQKMKSVSKSEIWPVSIENYIDVVYHTGSWLDVADS